ncbi:MAG: sensor histidine kinase [Ignavibacteriales bacterium]|nr:sensor histidine kinase [Ignavibacteriales bacterium]
MPEPTTEIWWLIIVGTTALLLISSIFIFTVYFNQKRFIASQKEKLKILEEGKQQLQESHKKLRQLAAHLQSVREEERARIAREIHDELGQLLTVMKMDIALLSKKLPSLSAGSKSEETTSDLKSMSELVDTTIKSVRRIATELRPEILDELGLKEAIEWEAQVFQTRTRIKCVFISEIDDITLDHERSTAVFRILQETLTNVARHAEATQVNLYLQQSDGNLVLRVADNGRGITAQEATGNKSLGLLGMRERVLLFGGEVIIEGESGKGTIVTVRLPIDQGRKQA